MTPTHALLWDDDRVDPEIYVGTEKECQGKAVVLTLSYLHPSGRDYLEDEFDGLSALVNSGASIQDQWQYIWELEIERLSVWIMPVKWAAD